MVCSWSQFWNRCAAIVSIERPFRSLDAACQPCDLRSSSMRGVWCGSTRIATLPARAIARALAAAFAFDVALPPAFAAALALPAAVAAAALAFPRAARAFAHAFGAMARQIREEARSSDATARFKPKWRWVTIVERLFNKKRQCRDRNKKRQCRGRVAAMKPLKV